MNLFTARRGRILRSCTEGVFATSYVLKSPDEISSGTYVEKGDLLVSKITPSFENGKQAIVEDIPTPFAYATTEVYPLHPDPKRLDRMYFFYYLKQSRVRIEIAGKMEGTTGRQRVPKVVVENYPIPLPPLPEQRAIAHILSTIQRAIAAQDAVIASAREVKRSLMHRLFTYGPYADPLTTRETESGEVPEVWRVGTLDDIKANHKGAIVSGPFGSNIGKRFFVDSGVPLIRGRNLTKGEKLFVEDGFVFITEEKAEELKSCTALANDLIFTAAGTLGQVGLIPKNSRYPKYVISNKQLRARIDESKAVPLFLFYWFSSPIIQDLIAQRRGGTSIPVINLSILRSLPVPLPSVAEQGKIAEMLSRADRKIFVEENRKAALQALFKSMLHQLMTGQVRVPVSH